MDLEKTVYRVIAVALLGVLAAAVVASLDDIRREIRILRM